MKRLACVIVLLAMAFTILLPQISLAHDRKEVAGLTVTFGAEPEPALTDQAQYLRWRFRSLASEEPYTELLEGEATIKRDGKEYGPFTARGSQRDPGQLQTMHIFTEPGDYDVRLTFRKGEDPEAHTVDFTYRIRDRRELEIPGKKVDQIG